jgi:hypothetical protein
MNEERKCRVCGCTDNDCSQCIEKTGQPCHWVEEDLCSACDENPFSEICTSNDDDYDPRDDETPDDFKE